MRKQSCIDSIFPNSDTSKLHGVAPGLLRSPKLFKKPWSSKKPLCLFALMAFLAACGDVTGFHGRMLLTGADSGHTNRDPLDYPTDVTFDQDGEISFAPGANNAEAGANFTYTLYRGQTPVPGFIDRPITSENADLALPAEMLSKAGVYTVRVTAHSVNPAYEDSSLASDPSTPVHVHAVTVNIIGDGVDTVTVNGVAHTETFTVYAFRYSIVTLTATWVGQRYVTWNGDGVTGDDTPEIRVIENIEADHAVAAVFSAPTPVITITTQPVATTTVAEGSISGSLAVAASVTQGATLSYQWFRNTIASNVGGSEEPGMTGTSFDIPTDLTEGQSFFFVEVRASGEAAPVRSTVATVTVRPHPLPVEMVRVQGGSFYRGRELGTASVLDTTPVFLIAISAFYLGRYQVTREQWTAVMTENLNGISATNPLWSTAAANAEETAAGFYMNRRPVTHVNWYDAIVFSNRLSIQRGLIPAYELPNQWPGATSWSNDPNTWGTVPTNSDARWDNVRIVPGSTGYRLPTEAQWEFAAKGGNAPGAYTFAGSNTATAVGWVFLNSGNSPRMVGLLPANSLELRDMAGNVREWVWDWFGLYTNTLLPDPEGASTGSGRVLRGASWLDLISSARSVFRFNDYPSDRSSSFGFRVSRPPPN